MKVKELIALLQTMPPDLQVWSYEQDLEPLHAPITESRVRCVAGDKWFPDRLIIEGDVSARP